MPAYKYLNTEGKVKWYTSFYYTDWLGKRKRKVKRGFDTRSSAKEFERLFLDKFSKSPTILFSSLVSNYLEDMDSRLKPTTLHGKKYMIETKILPFFGEIRICDIDADLVRRWQNELMDYRDEKGKPYAETYLYSMHSQLSAILNYAVKYYSLSSNPCRVAGSIGESHASEMNFWTIDQFEHALTFEQKPTYIVAFKLLFYTGMREGELLALTPEDFPRNTATVSINKNYAVVDGREYLLTPKTKRSIREITIPETLHNEVLEFIDNMCLDPDERIFYFQKSGLSTEFKRMTKRAGEVPIRIHDLRHSHAAMLIHMKFQIEEISRRLGHDSIKTTWDTYSHLYPGKEREVANKIEDLLMQETAPETSQKDSLVVDLDPESPLGEDSQRILLSAKLSGNEHIRKNNRNIFKRYGIHADQDQICGYPMDTYLDLISFGDSIVDLISAFPPAEDLRDLILALFSDAVLSCERRNGSIENLDEFLSETTIPKYRKIHVIDAK